MERREAERRARLSVRTSMRYLDGLIEELEQMNLADRVEVPVSFDAELKELRRMLPGLSVPAVWPTRVDRVLARCFQLQAQLQGQPVRAVH